MESIIQKAGRGNRAALMQLYETNKQAVFALSHGLIHNSTLASSIASWAITSAFQAIRTREVQSEEAFTAFALKQAAGYCKKEAIKLDAGAFRIPPQKDFHIPAIDENRIGKYASSLENYLNILPALHRFVFVLRYSGNLSVSGISECVGLEPAIIEHIMEAEPENLSRIYREVRASGGQCTPPTAQMLSLAFRERASAAQIPESAEKQILDYIDSVSIDRKISKKLAVWIGAAAVVFGLILFLFVSASGQQSAPVETAPTETSAATTQEAEPETEYTEPFNITSSQKKDSENKTRYYADISIADYGTITVALDKEAAPITVHNFVSLAEEGFYDGLTFHRIIEGFMMQGGDPNGDGTGGSDKTIKGEFTDNGVQNTLSHARGAISMARSNDYDSASSQFFIVHEDSNFLDGQYAVFGYVTDGMEIVDAICTAAEPTDSNGSIAVEAQPVITAIEIRTETDSSEIVAQVKEVRTDGTLLLHLYAREESAGDYEISDYADVDLDNFAYAFDTMEYTLGEELIVKTAENGTLVESNVLSVSAGDMIILYKDPETNVDTLIIVKESM